MCWAEPSVLWRSDSAKPKMRIALYGPFLFELAMGLRENPANDVQLFLDEETLPRSLLDEPQIQDSGFVRIGPWATRRAILRPRGAPITRALAEFDVALVTELGPIFAQHADTEYFFIPTGWDLTCGPFPIRSRSSRHRGLGDLSAAIIAIRLRSGIREASGIWGAPFMPFTRAANRLGCRLTADLPQLIDTNLFRPKTEEEETPDGFKGLTIFHPTRMIFTHNSFLAETGQWKGNDRLFRGFANAIHQGVDARLILIERNGSPDEKLARSLIDELGVSDLVKWLSSETAVGFSWRELAYLYRSSDLVVDTFGGWPGLISLEGASCGKPVLNQVDASVMALIHPDGHPYLQAHTVEEVCDVVSLLTNQELQTSIGDAGRKWILDNHDRGVVAKKCESLLRT
jgi:glycosyltransferase involved in cell wall biosynthesis